MPTGIGSKENWSKTASCLGVHEGANPIENPSVHTNHWWPECFSYPIDVIHDQILIPISTETPQYPAISQCLNCRFVKVSTRKAGKLQVTEGHEGQEGQESQESRKVFWNLWGFELWSNKCLGFSMPWYACRWGIWARQRIVLRCSE